MVAADLKIGGFNGSWGAGAAIDKKFKLLRDEGVKFDKESGKILPECVRRLEALSGGTEKSKAKKRSRDDE